jgi:hypothetical protein
MTPTGRQADWEQTTPDWQRRVRGYLLAEVERLERLSRHGPPGDSTARRCAAQILDWLDFGDFADARVRLAAIVGDIRLR